MRIILLFLLLLTIIGCSFAPIKELTPAEHKEWLQNSIKPGYSVWVMTVDPPDGNFEFVVERVDEVGFYSESEEIKFENVKHISWETPEQRNSFCARNRKSCELWWLVGAVVIWLPVIL